MLGILTNNLIFPYASLIFTGVLVLELLSRIQDESIKRTIICALSCGLLAWIDFYSFSLLFVLASVVFYIVKKKVPLAKRLYPVVLLFIFVLICIKDYSIIFRLRFSYIPLGVSYYFFRLISFLIEYSKSPVKYEKISPLAFFSWVFFFPILLAGPIVRFHEFQALEPSFQQERKYFYYRNSLIALVLKLILVDYILFNSVYGHFLPSLQNNFASWSRMHVFAFLLAFSFLALLHAYFDLMLYTEMSKGVAGILGYTNVENFNKPLAATNISQFWQKWHMSLSNWTRDYVFFPALIKTRSAWIATYASMLTIGVWHSLTINWIVWALSHASAINFYSILRKTKIFVFMQSNRKGRMLLKYFGILATVFFVSMIFSVVAIKDFHLIFSIFLKIIFNVKF